MKKITGARKAERWEKEVWMKKITGARKAEVVEGGVDEKDNRSQESRGGRRWGWEGVFCSCMI